MELTTEFGEEIAVLLRLHGDIRKPLKDAGRLQMWHRNIARSSRRLEYRAV